MQWNRVQLVLLIVFAVLPGKLVAQTESPDYAALQEELNQNRAVWDASKGDAYTMTITRVCFCPIEAVGPFTLTIVNGVITSVEPENEFSDGLPTVDGVFDEIQDAINDRVDQLTVSYDATLGYPTSVYIDPDFMIADEENGYEISVTLIDGDETPGETPGGPSAPQCDPSLVSQRAPVVRLSRKALTNGFSIGEYTANILRWRSYLQSVNCVYRYKLTRSCFCTTDFVGPFIISVENGGVVDAEFEGDVETPVPTDLPTITQLFEIILDEAQEADEVDIEYDSGTGVPIRAFFDRTESTADDEITYLAELL